MQAEMPETHGKPASVPAVSEVGPRDGLQNHPKVLPVKTRVELVDRLATTGLRRLEVTSFVNEKRVPAMAGSDQVAEEIDRPPNVKVAGLILNARGFERLAAADLDEVHMAFAATDELNLRNQNATTDESLQAAAEIIALAHGEGRRATVTIAASFGCPFAGVVDPRIVVDIAERLFDAGSDEVVFADTIGVGVPRQVTELVAGGSWGGDRVGVHLHDTRGTGIANAYAALEAGVAVIDAAVGGLGGCPFSPGASGNIATEDLVYMLEGQGVATGIDLDALIEVGNWLEGVLGTELPGQVRRAGKSPA
jgi:isopropylmalate/homocitrate/citramalate synthase